MRHSAQFLLVASLAMVALVHASELVPAVDLEDGRIAAKDTVAATVLAQSPSADPTGDALPDVDLAILLDSDADRVARQDQFALLEQHAARGEGFGNYVLGTLYRLGAEHPAELVDRNTDRARAHLRQAALAGEVWAMSGLGELLLMEGELRAALLWAHASRHYRSVYEQLAGRPDAPRDTYAADLLQRCRAALESTGDRNPIKADFDAFVTQNDVAIRAGMVAKLQATTQHAQAKPQNRLVQQPPPPTYGTHVVPLSEPGWALYWIGVDRAGKVRHVQLLDFAPHPRFGRRFRGKASSARFNRSPDADPVRWALLPIQLSPRR